MTTIIKFPSKMPAPGDLELPRVQLSVLLNGLSAELLQLQGDLMKANSAPEIAAVVRMAVDKLAEANTGWAVMAQTIRDSWGC